MCIKIYHTHPEAMTCNKNYVELFSSQILTVSFDIYFLYTLIKPILEAIQNSEHKFPKNTF
jgi:hypothetical protein